MVWLRRTAWFLTGLAWFLWIGYEDQNVAQVVVIAALIDFTLGVEVLYRWATGVELSNQAWFVRSMLVGGVSGAGVGLTAALLVLLKVSLHQHPNPDFSAADVALLLTRTPAWTVVGLLFGAAGGFLGWGRPRSD
jgi:hypothetical protein